VAEVLARYAVRVGPEERAEVPGTGLTVRVLRYFPHWQIPLSRDAEGNVVAGEARNLSDQPRNPAVEVLLEAPGQEPKRRWVPLPPPHGHRRREPFSLDYGDYRLTATSFDPVHITGLSFKTHPVLWPVWLGCGVMMLGICLAFYANHERVWVLARAADGGSELFLAGNAFKWRDRFRRRFDAVVAELVPTTKDASA
jgi:cytochrome c biogenesis protein ResB